MEIKVSAIKQPYPPVIITIELTSEEVKNLLTRTSGSLGYNFPSIAVISEKVHQALYF